MIHYSVVTPQVFAKIKTGHKVIEPRLNDDVHRKVKLGDMIMIINRATHQQVLVKVVGVLRYATFDELFSKFAPSYYGFDTLGEAMKEVRRWYSPQAEQQHGVLGIKVHVLGVDKTA